MKSPLNVRCVTVSLHFHMESVSFELSGRGVGDAAALAKRKFVFVVGGVEYRCCRFQACFVSGLVRRLLASDYCLSRVSLQVRNALRPRPRIRA